MPIFEFRCQKCGKEFEELILPSDSRITCPDCKGEEVEKLISICSFVSKDSSGNITASSSNKCSSCSSSSCSTCSI